MKNDLSTTDLAGLQREYERACAEAERNYSALDNQPAGEPHTLWSSLFLALAMLMVFGWCVAIGWLVMEMFR